MPTINSDIVLTPVGTVNMNVKATKITPIYLVSCESPFEKEEIKFVATKLDDISEHYVRLVGFKTKKFKDNDDYQKLLNSVDKTQYKELMIPWQRVITIENLIFRQK